MGNANLLVPGTAGITLQDGRGNDLGYPARMQLGVVTGGLIGRSAESLVNLLSMEHKPGRWAPTRTSFAPGVSIRPGHVLKVAYNQVPGSFHPFLYDWRQDIRHSARELLTFLRDNRPRRGRWNVVGHSQGGLLAVVASKLCEQPRDFADVVASVTLVGCPLAGTVNAAHALLAGDLMGKAAAPEFREIVRSWPSLYQMMPAWGAVASPGNRPTPADKQMMVSGGWTGHAGLSSDLLSRGRALQRLVRNPLGNMEGDIDVAIILAKNRKTRVNLVRNARLLTARCSRFEMGDSLVPHARTLNWLDGFAQQFVLTLRRAGEHSFLFSDPAVMGEVTRRLR